MATSIDHVHIFTETVSETVSFYQTFFNAQELRRVQGNGGELVHLAVGNSRIVVSNNRPVGIPHFAISVGDITKFTSMLRKQGIRIEDTGAVPGYDNAFIRDNNGILIELISPSTQ